jgi:pimeloyl-ACP methyl ester carboxylesterase
VSITLRRPLTVVATIVAGLAGAALTFAGVAGATPPDQPDVSGGDSRPTIVLVHGGWADSSGWNAQIKSLRDLGYPVIAPANPLRGLSSDADYVRSVVDTIDGPVVLVGHSYGGAVISNAAVGAPNVEALVYIAAFAPDEGESLAQLVTMNPGTMITPEALIERPYPVPDGQVGVDLYLKPEIFRSAFAGDLPRRTTDLMEATQRPFSVAAFTEASGDPAWRSIPSWYLVATEDHAIPPRTQEFMAERAGAHVSRVRASHVPMLSQPEVTTKIVLAATRAVS